VRLLIEGGAQVHILDPLILRRAELHGTRFIKTLLRWPLVLLHLWRFSRQHNFDLVHSNCAPTLGGALLARWHRTPHVWHVHEIFDQAPATRMFFERLLVSADLVLAASGAVEAQFKSQRLRSRCHIAYTGAEVSKAIATSIPLTKDQVEVICVARLNHWKGQEYLIRAVGLLRDRGVIVRLSLVGDVYAHEIQFREQLISLIETLDLKDAIQLLGERRDVHHLMAQADIVVVPSALAEPFGIVVVEAMALGRPLIATDAGGPSEIVTSGHDGLLVALRDAPALAEAIDHLITNSALARELGMNAKHTAQRFTHAALADAVIANYNHLLS
jgi:glycosyltransferase involved in cell wall biosynthesis